MSLVNRISFSYASERKVTTKGEEKFLALFSIVQKTEASHMLYILVYVCVASTLYTLKLLLFTSYSYIDTTITPVYRLRFFTGKIPSGKFSSPLIKILSAHGLCFPCKFSPKRVFPSMHFLISLWERILSFLSLTESDFLLPVLAFSYIHERKTVKL